MGQSSTASKESWFTLRTGSESTAQGTRCCSAFGCSCPPDPGAQYPSLWSMVRLLSPLSQRSAHRKSVEIGFIFKKPTSFTYTSLTTITNSYAATNLQRCWVWVIYTVPASEFPAWTQCPLPCALGQHYHFQRHAPEGDRIFMWERAVATTVPNQRCYYLWFGKGWRGCLVFNLN